ncbi:MAG TPA: glycosyltransferase [Solirubrobacterales bacterium]|jgi:spore maturation protein CgeB|nr:glycosyltransferase [Solirubrobacterales bacterium]
MRIAFFGSSLVSAYWNGACTYYRGIVRALDARGHRVTFYEPDAFERQAHRDIDDPAWAEVVVYAPSDERAVRKVVAGAADADVAVKASGVGVFDAVLEEAVAELEGPEARIFWDVDAPATLASMEEETSERGQNPLRELIPAYEMVFTYGGGQPVIDRYLALGARSCTPIYNALDPETHHPEPPRPELACDLAFLGNRLPDREARVEEFFFSAVEALPQRSFLLGGNGWEDRVAGLGNVRYLGHVPPGDHNALNRSARAVLNVSRESMASNGWSPATRVFEATGAGACLITDEWQGLEDFLAPDEEALVARDGAEVAELLESLKPDRARAIGEAALERVLAEHTYDRRAEQVEAILTGVAAR